jgi:hypothetical protein
MWPFNTGDCLIEVTTQAGFIEYEVKFNVRENIFTFFINFILAFFIRWSKQVSVIVIDKASTLYILFICLLQEMDQIQ